MHPSPRDPSSSKLRLACMVGMLVSSLNCIAPAMGQSDTPDRGGDRDDGSVEIRLAELPKPTPEVAALIRSGTVRLITGGQPTSDAASLPVGQRLAGETRFTFRYRYDSRARWQIESRRNALSQTMVSIRVRFRSIKLISTHDVWLRSPPSEDRFWDDRVVRHEFDHVRISSDPRIEKHFLDAVKALEVMRVPLSSVAGRGGKIENAKVQSLIEAGMKQALNNTTDYVRIRYRELDRLTRHGMLPLPDDVVLVDEP
ncbi:DUF922 domain-containing Zn-dependent protease [Stieleria sp. ICT_E10.1]|uniref:DUF922 domain-containing Zn-dependent protease n=1 Tax=Stieleria sedimenti TaxID=2976331 RepID=UPI0021801728|nr:DUF922 domain-containing Zn-dependent protease [Stieleria sedimenti]MCS7467978.1 DUF922 domain-containing Zn-dependent protease [Stieleria sedimenti]